MLFADSLFRTMHIGCVASVLGAFFYARSGRIHMETEFISGIWIC